MKNLISLLSIVLVLGTVTRLNAMNIGVFEAGTTDTSLQKTYSNQATALNADTVRLIYNIFGGYAVDNSQVAYMTSEMSAFHANGIKVTLTITGPLCSNHNGPGFPAQGEFGNFMKALLAQFGSAMDMVSSVEVWNEWDNGYGYAPACKPFTLSQYVELLSEAYPQIKAVNPNIKVISGSVVMNHESYLSTIAKSGFADEIGYHPYSTTAAGIQSRVAMAQAAVNNPAFPLAITEWGCDSSWENCSNWYSEFPKAFDDLETAGIAEADYYILAQPPYAYDMTTFSLLNTAGGPDKLFSIFQTETAKYTSGQNAQPADQVGSSSNTMFISGLGSSADQKCLDTWKSGTETDLWDCGTNGGGSAKANQGFLYNTASNPNQLVELSGNLCLDSNSSNTTNAVAVIGAKCDPTSASQQWTYSTTTLEFTNKANGKCLEVLASNSTNGSTIETSTCGSSAKNQQWTPSVPMIAVASPSATPTAILNTEIISALSTATDKKCLDTWKSGTETDLWDCGTNGGGSIRSNQEFSYSPAAHAFQIVESGGSLCLDSNSSTATNAVPAIGTKCSAVSLTQQWTYSSSTKEFVNKSNAKCLEVLNSSTTNGVVLETSACTGAKNQQWSF